jgi:hypothetical protein
MFESVSRLVEPDIPCAASACDTFEPSETSCEQFLAELNDEEEDDEEDEDEDEEDDEFEEEEFAEDEPPLDVVWLAELLLPPQPAASATSAVTEAIANACLMPNPPMVACAGEPTAWGAPGLGGGGYSGRSFCPAVADRVAE